MMRLGIKLFRRPVFKLVCTVYGIVYGRIETPMISMASDIMILMNVTEQGYNNRRLEIETLRDYSCIVAR